MPPSLPPPSMLPEGSVTKHGFPAGFGFVPTHLELCSILSRRINGRPLAPQVASIFKDVRLLDYHPSDLYEQLEGSKEHGYVYFFSYLEYQGAAGSVQKKRQRGIQDNEDDGNAPRPKRTAPGGVWKPSGGHKDLYRPKKKGGGVAGKMVTMVFYDRFDDGDKVQDKTDWGMHEFTVPLDPCLLKATKKTRYHDLALYRLYPIRNGDRHNGAGVSNTGNHRPLARADGASTSQMPPQQQHPIPSVGHMANYSAVPPFPPGQLPSPFRLFTRNQPPHAAGPFASSQMQPRPGPSRAQYYPHQYAFGAAHQEVRTTMPPPAYATRLPGGQLFRFACRSPAPTMALPPAAANPESQLQPVAYGDGQGAGHSGATRSPPSPASVPTPPAEELAPMAAATHGAGQEAGHFRVTRSPQAEQHGLSAACAEAEPMEEEAPPRPEDMVPPSKDVPMIADGEKYDAMVGIVDWGMNDNDYLQLDDDRFQFTMDELLGKCPMLEEPPPPTQGDKDNNLHDGAPSCRYI